jgi:bacillithiol system protein YtxJ
MTIIKEITTLEEWNQALEGSVNQPVCIIKHSTTCPVSAAAWEEFQGYVKEAANTKIKYLLVKVIEARPVSNQIAEDLNVKHESPQTILITNKEATWHASHWSITNAKMNEILS